MRRYLVVLNRTRADSRLLGEVFQRVTEGPARFDVLVPATRPHTHELTWTDGIAGLQARRRLNDALARLHARSIEATGTVGDVNARDAVETVLRRTPHDEIILSTPPAGPSRWLRLDLPHRLARRTHVPVTTITTAPAEVGEPAH